MVDPLHNEFPPESLEAKDLAHLLHPTTNLQQHHQIGPTVHAKAKGRGDGRSARGYRSGEPAGALDR